MTGQYNQNYMLLHLVQNGFRNNNIEHIKWTAIVIYSKWWTTRKIPRNDL